MPKYISNYIGQKTEKELFDIDIKNNISIKRNTAFVLDKFSQYSDDPVFDFACRWERLPDFKCIIVGVWNAPPQCECGRVYVSPNPSLPVSVVAIIPTSNALAMHDPDSKVILPNNLIGLIVNISFCDTLENQVQMHVGSKREICANDWEFANIVRGYPDKFVDFPITKKDPMCIPNANSNGLTFGSFDEDFRIKICGSVLLSGVALGGGTFSEQIIVNNQTIQWGEF